MRYLAALCALAACHEANHDSGGDAAVPDANCDAAVDGSTGSDAPPLPDADTSVPLALVGVTPDTNAWLHGPIRVAYNAPIASCTVSATLDGQPVAATSKVGAHGEIVIGIDRAARSMGTLAIHVDSISDTAGRSADAVDKQWQLAPWSAIGLDRGAATGEPSIAVADDGTVYAAWLAGGQVVVGSLGDVAANLGDPLGASATQPAITIVNGAPVVAWSDGSAVQQATWSNGWTMLPALTGTAVRASGGMVAPIAGGVLTLGAATLNVGANPAFAADGGKAIAAWVDSGAVKAARFDGTAWTAMDAIGAPGATRVSVALRGDAAAIAWDATAGSSGVSAALAAGTSWTRLGLLDVDPADEATLPAIAIGADGNPVAAWREDFEGTPEGVLARWDGAKWHPLGGRSWSPSVAAPVLALHAGGAPVIAAIAGGALSVARFDGPVDPGVAIARASIAGCSVDPTNPPALISATGCFDLATPKQPKAHAGLVPYDVYVELWTDGAKKRRWFAMPDGAPAMTVSATDAWTAPVGTMMVKEFALETTPGNAATRRPIETRFLVNTAASGWLGVSYKWNAAGTDATINPDQETIGAWAMDDGSTHQHEYPSRSECASCHASGYGPLLGIRSPQLDRWFDYNGVIAEQLPTLAALGIGPGTAAQRFPSPHDPSESAEHRMRGYMATNCVHCHNPTSVGIWDARITTPLAQTGLCDKLVPGNAAGSKVYQLVSSRPGMPKLGSLAVDPLAVSMLGTWINGMTSCP